MASILCILFLLLPVATVNFLLSMDTYLRIYNIPSYYNAFAIFINWIEYDFLNWSRFLNFCWFLFIIMLSKFLIRNYLKQNCQAWTFFGTKHGCFLWTFCQVHTTKNVGRTLVPAPTTLRPIASRILALADLRTATKFLHLTKKSLEFGWSAFAVQCIHK